MSERRRARERNGDKETEQLRSKEGYNRMEREQMQLNEKRNVVRLGFFSESETSKGRASREYRVADALQ